MDFLKVIADMFFGFFIAAEYYFSTWYKNTASHGVDFSLSTMLPPFFIAVIFCGSIMASMTIAEMKVRNRLPHALLGAVIPVIYPVLIYFTLPKASENSVEQEEETAKPVHDVPSTTLKSFRKVETTDEIPPPPDEPVGLNQAYFTSIAKDEHGDYRGPFMLELTDGQLVEIACIMDTFDAAVAVRIGEDNDAKTIRLPYPKIASCKTKEQWLAESEAEVDA